MTRDPHLEMLKKWLLDQTVMIHHKPKVYGEPWFNATKVSLFSRDSNDVELCNLHGFFGAKRNIADLRDIIHVSLGDPSSVPGLPLPEITHKTLFLDLDETLISHVRLTDEKRPDQYDFLTKYCYVIKRLGVDRLLQVATDHDYEVVVFTAGSINYASPIIDQLDPLKLIAHQLCKDSCKDDLREKHVYKDLASTGIELPEFLTR